MHLLLPHALAKSNKQHRSASEMASGRPSNSPLATNGQGGGSRLPRTIASPSGLPSTGYSPTHVQISSSMSAAPTGGGLGAVQLVQLTAQSKLLQPELVSVMKKVQDIERTFEQRERRLEAERAAMLEEQKQAQDELLQWRANEDGQLTDRQTHLEMEEKALNQRIKWEKDRLKDDREDFEQKCKEGEYIAHHQEPVTVEVGGEKFRTELSTLTKCKDSLFPDLVRALERRQETERDGRLKRDAHIFIDRDSRYFRFILNYLRQGEQVMRGGALKKADREDLQDVLFEVQYYRLTDLERLVRRKMVSLKRPVNFNQLMDEVHCFAKLSRASQPQSPQEAQDAANYSYVTVKDIHFKGENLKGIVFDKVIFQHSVVFQNCILMEAKFIECSFRGAMNLSDADLYRAKFDHCDGIDLENHLYLDKANTNEIQFVPPLEDDS